MLVAEVSQLSGRREQDGVELDLVDRGLNVSRLHNLLQVLDPMIRDSKVMNKPLCVQRLMDHVMDQVIANFEEVRSAASSSAGVDAEEWELV